ncbi:MAG: PadR family transcriptional regulator [Treponema sp.]|nr:PadR family transcriptional regulator [Treponema sp.]
MLNYSDILRGLTDTIILEQLNHTDSYGYQINKFIRECSNDKIELKEATLYTSFRRLEDSELILSYWGDENSGARRRYYSITEKGRAVLKENKEDWAEIQKLINKLIVGKGNF